MLLKRKRETGLPQLDTNVYEITPYTFRKIEYPNRRMNLLVPSINAEHVFGGISTALKFFDTLVKALGYDARIILVDAEPDKAAIKKYSDEYTFVKAEVSQINLWNIVDFKSENAEELKQKLHQKLTHLNIQNRKIWETKNIEAQINEKEILELREILKNDHINVEDIFGGN